MDPSIMEVGDVVGTKSITRHIGDSTMHMSMSHKAKKGQRLVFLFLGTEEIDGEPLDPVKRIQQLGWSNPEFPTHVGLAVSGK